jgi:hypothetical protein
MDTKNFTNIFITLDVYIINVMLMINLYKSDVIPIVSNLHIIVQIK